MDQIQLAEALGVSRSAVNAWINDRAYPMNSIGALEDLLGVDLTGDGQAEVYTDPEEAALWALDRFSEDDRRKFIAALRAARRDRAG